MVSGSRRPSCAYISALVAHSVAVSAFSLRFGMSVRYIGGQVRASFVKVGAHGGIAEDACLSGYETHFR